ncbi:helix-turn-helix domain-containing protein [Halalkalibaculum sp. DA384]|uniref:helix-turn-helix domain-containing protein n=1 Tax=Halalkalibaculum sp. DA384 TaxID=3373606 RepID=UPI003753F2E4
MEKITAGKSINKLRLLKTISSALAQLFQVKASTKTDSSAIGVNENTARKVASYLDNCLATPFPGMDFLAATFGISVSGLKRHFKKEFNTTPFQYYRRKKMQLACRKLEESELTVTEIAFQLGFNNPSNFIRAFKTEFDTTPGRYREYNSPM